MVIDGAHRNIFAIGLFIPLGDEHEAGEKVCKFVFIAFLRIFGEYHYGDILRKQLYALFHCACQPAVGICGQQLHTLIHVLGKEGFEERAERGNRLARTVLLNVQHVAQVMIPLFIISEHRACSPLYVVGPEKHIVNHRAHLVCVVGKVKAVFVGLAADRHNAHLSYKNS